MIGLACATFSPTRPGRAKTHPCPCEGLPPPPFVLHPHAREWPDHPLLRASNEHCLTVRVLRARRMAWPLPSHPFATARCASKEADPSVPLFYFHPLKDRETPMRGWWGCPQLRASNEGLLRPRVARAKRTAPPSPMSPPSPHPQTLFNTSRYASSIFPKSFRNRSLSIDSFVV